MAPNKVGFPSASEGLLTDIDTTQKNPLGLRQVDDAGNEWIYLIGVAALRKGDFVTYNPTTFQTTRLVAAAVGPVALAALANPLAAQYGWFLIKGTGLFNNKAAVTINTQLYISNSSGSADSTYVSGDQLHGTVSVTSSTGVDLAQGVTAYLNYPWCNAHTDS